MQQRKGRFNEMLMSSDCFSERFLMDEKPKKSLHPLKIFFINKTKKGGHNKGAAEWEYECTVSLPTLFCTW